MPRALGALPYNSFPLVFGPTGDLAVRGDTLLVSDALLYRSRDGGRTWDTAHDWGRNQGVLPGWAGDRLFAKRSSPECGNCLLRSEDLGTTWTVVDTLNPLLHATRFQSDGERLYMLAATGVFSGADGMRWETLDATLWPTSPYMAVGDGHMAVGVREGRLRDARLPVLPAGVRPRPARAGPKPNARIVDRSGRPRKANGALGK